MRLAFSIAVSALAACGNAETEAPAGVFTLERTACFGFCPIYKATVSADEQLVFEGERFVVAEGRQEKRLPDGSFAKLVDIASAHDFASFDAKYPNEDRSNCPSEATDHPGIIVTLESEPVTHGVEFYTGCYDFEGRDRLAAMIAEMDGVLSLDSWIGPREPFMGGEEP